MNLYKFLYWLQKKEFYLWLENDSLKFKQTQQLKNKEKVFLLLKSQKENIIKILKKNNIFSSNIKYPFIYKTDKTEAILSSAQERLFFLDQLEQGTNAYNIPYLLKLKKTISSDIFVKAIKAVIDTNLILKTVYIEKQNSFIQQPLMKELEINSFTPENSKEFNSLLKNKFDYIFDLKNEFPIKVDVLEYNNSTFISLVFHHIAFDGWSTDIFFNEVEANYIKLANPQQKCKDSSDNHSIQYKDFAVWQKNYITNNYLQEQLKFWKAYLEDYDNLNFPTDKKRPNNFNYKGNYTSINIPSSILDFFKTTAKNNNTSLFCTLLTTYYIFLYKYTVQNDIVIGTPFANRHINGTENIIGFFINTLPIRMNIDSNSTFQELIIKVNNHLEKIQKNQDIPFEQIVNSIDPEKDLSRTPIYQTTFAVHEKNDNKNQYYNFIGTEKFERTSKFDLDLTIIINNNTATIFFNYSTELFTRSYIKQISNHYIHLLSTLATSNYKQQIKDICLLTKEEYQTVVYDWNKTDFSYPKEKTIQQLFEKQVEITPHKIAIESGNYKISFSELNKKANQLAYHIRHCYKTLNKKELIPDTLIGIYLDKNIEMIVSILGIIKAGAAYIPFDRNDPDERLKFKITNSNCKIIITNTEYENKFTSYNKGKLKLINILSRTIKTFPEINPTLLNTSKDLLYIIYTSGSTGHPKGVMIEHKNYLNYFYWLRQYTSINQNDNIDFSLSIAFDGATTTYLATLLNGAKIVICPNNIFKDIEKFTNHIFKNKITLIKTTPSYFNLFKITSEKYLFLKKIILGGENVNISKINTFLSYNKHISIYNEYGPTEATVGCSQFTFTSNKKLIKSIIGKPAHNTCLYILSETQIPLPIGSTGELYISGSGLARGYLNQNKLTNDKFIMNPFLINTKMYKTGDLCKYLKDGNIEYIKRNDNQIKINGFRIELNEIEAKLLEYDKVSSCTVILNKSLNMNKTLLVAYYTLSPKVKNIKKFYKRTIQEEIKTFLISMLPDYMIPKIFIEVDSIPLTINGKIDYNKLPAPFSIKDNNYIPPQSELEKKICLIWKNILDIKKISINDDFFKLGGDSISSILLISELNKIDIFLTIKDIFNLKTIKDIVKYVNNNDSSTNKVYTEQGLLHGSFPLLPIQEWFFRLNLNKPNHYNQSFLIKVPKLNIKKLEAAIRQLVLQHDILRVVFPSNQQQKYLKKITFNLITFNRSLASEEELQNNFTKWQSNFDLFKGPLWQVCYIYGYNDDSARIFFAAHHLIIDLISWRIISSDLEMLYNGKKLLPKKSSYRQWVQTIINYPQTYFTEKEFWKSYLLSTSKPKLIAQSYSNKEDFIYIDKKMTDTLFNKCNYKYDTTINELLLSALNQTLLKTFNLKEITIALEGHGRESIDDKIDCSSTLGWFTCFYPFTFSDSIASIAMTIGNIKNKLRSIPHKGIGYGAFFGYKNIPNIYFNYHGHIENEIRNYWNISNEEAGNTIIDKNGINALININCWIANEKLAFNIFSKLELTSHLKLIHNIKKSIHTIIDHCSKISIPEYFDSFDNFLPFKKIILSNKFNSVYCFPTAYSNSEEYEVLPRENIIQKNLYLFNSLPLYLKENHKYPILNFQEITKIYSNEIIRKKDKNGIELFGWSFGGLLAFETAHQLLKKGFKVKKIIILDSYFGYKKFLSEKNISATPEDIVSDYSPEVDVSLFKFTEIILLKATIPTLTSIKNKYYNNVNPVFFESEKYYLEIPDNKISTIIPDKKIKIIPINCSHFSWKHDMQTLKLISSLIDS